MYIEENSRGQKKVGSRGSHKHFRAKAALTLHMIWTFTFIS